MMKNWYSWRETDFHTKVLLVLLFLPSMIILIAVAIGVGVWDGVGWWQNKIAGWFEWTETRGK